MKASVAIQVLPKADNDQELVRIVDEVIAYIYPDAQAKDASGQREKDGAVAVKATISGILRGLIRDGYPVTKGFKIADIDPRESEYENCFTISDKARCIAGGVLEALLHAGILPE